jgi:hypothetical protein
MTANISELLRDGKQIKANEANAAIRYAQPGSPGDGDWPPARTYWEGYAEGREAGEAHGRRLAEIEFMFAADDAERRGYERGRNDGIAECGWPQLCRELGGILAGFLWWAVVVGFFVLLMADTFIDGKEAGLREARQTVTVEKKASVKTGQGDLQ